MAEKTTPELPFTLAKDEDGDTLTLKWDELEGRYFVVISGPNPWVDPAELMRNLARFVPEVEPATAPSVEVHETPEELAARIEEVTVDRNGWRDKAAAITGLKARIRELEAAVTEMAPAPTAPSVEQIDEEIRKWYVGGQANPDSRREVAEAIHALYGTPADAGASPDISNDGEHMRYDGREWVAVDTLPDLQRHGRNCDERVRKLETLLKSAQDSEDALDAELEQSDGLVKGLRAEVERYKAALDAAEALIVAQRATGEKQADYFNSYAEGAEIKAKYVAARAAVEAETNGEAGA